MNIKYSVIIPTYNRADLLKNCLEAVAVQSVSHDSYEIIVINDGSRDHSDSVIETFKRQNPYINFACIKQENCGVSHARNRGIERAQGEIVFFTDDDCVVPPNWIETLADGYRRHPDVGGVGGWYRYTEDALKKSSYAAYTSYEFAAHYVADKEIKTRHFINPAGNTSNMSYRKSALDKVGGFDEEMRTPGFEDWDLKVRFINSGFLLLYMPFFVLHVHPLSAREVASRMFKLGMGRRRFIERHPELMYWYYPGIKELFNYILPRIPATCIDLRSMAFIQFILTRLGWEYERAKRC